MDELSYGVVGDCYTAALISDKDSIGWLYFPSFNSPSIFTSLFDREKGEYFNFGISPDYQTSQSCVPYTSILSTNFISEENEFTVVDFMPRYHLSNTSNCHRPTEIYRYIRRIKGTPCFKVNYEPAPDYARGKTIFNTTSEYIKTYSTFNSKDKQYLCSSLPLRKISEQKEVILAKGEFLLLSYNEEVIPVNIEREKLECCRTLVYWLD